MAAPLCRICLFPVYYPVGPPYVLDAGSVRVRSHWVLESRGVHRYELPPLAQPLDLFGGGLLGHPSGGIIFSRFEIATVTVVQTGDVVEERRFSDS